MPSNIQKKLEWVIKGLVTLTFFVPFIVGYSSFIFPFIVPKILIFRSLVLVMLAVYAALLVYSWKDYRPRWSPITLVLSLFLLSATLSTIFGADWYHSFWDRHERMLGLFTLIHYFLYYLILTAVVRDKQDWLRFGQIFAGCASVVMILGIIQKFNPQFLLNNGSERVSATLGNSIYLGGYGLWLFFFSLLLSFWEENKWLRIALAGGALLGLVGVFISGTRGSFLGLLAGFMVTLAMYALTLPREHKRARQALMVVGVGMVLLGAVLIIFRHKPLVANIPTVGKLLNTSFTTGTASTRLMAWSIAVEGWRERPILGWGPNNYIYVFNKFYRAEFLENGWGETWFDNAHNIIVNTLAVQGVFGIVTYLGLFAVVILSLVRSYRRGQSDRHLLSLGTAFLAAHLIQNVFVFENPTSYLFFFFMLGLLNNAAAPAAATDSAPAHQATRGVSLAPLAVTGLIGISLALALIYVTNINPARANRSMLVTLRKIYRGDGALAQYEKTIGIPTPHIDDIRNDFARAATVAAPEYARQGRAAEAEAILLKAYEELGKNRLRHPLDIRVHMQQAQTGQLIYEMTKRVSFIQEAEKTLEEAVKFSPERQQIHYMLASARFFLGDIDGAAAVLRRSIDYDPVISEGWWRLAYILQNGGRSEEAKAVVREAREKGVVFDPQGTGIVNAILPPR